jgi:hypothetical protein
MKVTFTGSLAIVRPFGFLEINIAPSSVSEANLKQIYSRQISAILLSLKNVTFFSPLWLNSTCEHLSSIARDVGADFAICDYNSEFFDFATKASKNIMRFSFFESEKIASLFLSDEVDFYNKTVVIYSKNDQYKEYIGSLLQQRCIEIKFIKNLQEFNTARYTYEYVVGPLNHIVLSKKDIEIFKKDNVVIYKINGLIDSSLIQKFDQKFHKKLLRIGYKFFVFWSGSASALNTIGANFLIKLSETSQKNGGVLVICGLNENNISATLALNLKSANILLYKCIDEFFMDNSTIYFKKRLVDVVPTNINKKLVEILPVVVSSVTDVLSPLIESEILCLDAKISNFNIENESEFLRACVLFYGDVEMRILLGIKKDKLDKICSIFSENSEKECDYLSGFSQIFSIIASKIIAIFIERELKVKMSAFKIYENEMFFDRASSGILATLNSKESQTGMIFVSK